MEYNQSRQPLHKNGPLSGNILLSFVDYKASPIHIVYMTNILNKGKSTYSTLKIIAVTISFKIPPTTITKAKGADIAVFAVATIILKVSATFKIVAAQNQGYMNEFQIYFVTHYVCCSLSKQRHHICSSSIMVWRRCLCLDPKPPPMMQQHNIPNLISSGQNNNF